MTLHTPTAPLSTDQADQSACVPASLGSPVAARQPALRPRVVTVLGLEHSGTTLLARMLGTHPDAVAIGGLKNFASFVQHRKRCSCGGDPDSCAFWLPVLDHLRKDGLDPADLATALSGRRSAPVPARQAAGQLIAAIVAASGAAMIVDASRDPEWSQLLRPLAGIEMVPVHIFKSPLAQAASAKRKERSVYGELAKYISRSRACRAETRRATAAVTLAHEDLCATPGPLIARIMDRLGLDPDPRQVADWGSRPLHMLGGNRKRRSTSSDIQSDRGWSGILSPLEITLVRIAGGAAYAANQRQSQR